MIKCILKCKYCENKSNSYDDGDSILEIDFKDELIYFLCPKCGKSNRMVFSKIQKNLEKKSRLPGIGGSR